MQFAARFSLVCSFDMPLFSSCIVLLTVEPGHRAVMFDRFRGIMDEVSEEGTHFKIPFIQVRRF
jgi:hypothetical protein